MLWDRGYWAPADGTNPEKALRKGELKFNLAGEKLQGGWVIVRMRKDRDGGKRNNWLLIKHRDGYEKEAGGSILDEDQSVASGRSMEAIAGGEGRGPSPFMLSARKAAVPDAVWHSNRGQKAVPLQATPASRKSPKIAASGDLPSFVPPQLCKTASRPPLGESWVHEIKLDGYRMQLRIGDGEARLRTPKGLEIGAHEGRNLDAVNQSKLAVVCGSVPTASIGAAPAGQVLNPLVDVLFLEIENLSPRRLSHGKALRHGISHRPRASSRLFQERSVTGHVPVRFPNPEESMETFSELFEETLKDIYYAEKAILKALPKMAKKASSKKLQAAFTKHQKETEGQVERLEQVFELLGKRAAGKKCAAIEGIIEEAEEVMKEAKEDTIRDAAMLAAAQAVEHYEISRYGTLVAWAEKMGMSDAAELLNATLEEEKATDEKLTELAESEINVEAEVTDDEEQPKRRAAGGRSR